MKKEKVLLIAPNLNGFRDGVNRIQPPLGLMLIAAQLEKDGHEVRIHDTALEGWNTTRDIRKGLIQIGQTNDEISNVISDFNPKIIAVSVLFSNLTDSAHEIMKIAKGVNNKIITFLGGNHLSNAVKDYEYNLVAKHPKLSDQIADLEDTNIDLGMIGEGDFAFAKVVISAGLCTTIPSSPSRIIS